MVSIASHTDEDPYEPLTTIAGTITDAATADGIPGEIDTAVFDVNAGQLSGDVLVGSDGAFSFDVSTSGITGTVLITVSATDWNGNTGSASVALAAPKEITYFAFLASNLDNAAAGVSADTVGLISGTQITVSITEEAYRDNLVATFLATGLVVKVGAEEQTSGSTMNDFTSQVTYVVTANDGSAKSYTVLVGAMPIAPSGLTISNVTNNSIDLSWTDNADNEDGFEIERSAGGGAFVGIGSVGANIETYSDVGLTPLNYYLYRVRSYNSTWMSSWSNETGTTTLLLVQREKLLASDGAANDQFGSSVSISGSYALIGAYSDDDSGSDSGSAYLFERNGVGVWQEVQKLTPSDGAAGDQFSSSNSVSGNYALVGAFLDDDSGDASGSAYVFERDGTGTWQEVQKLTPSDGAEFDQFSIAISVSDNYAAIGAPYDDDDGNNSGSVYVFERDGAGTWQDAQKLTASDGAANDQFGWSVSVSGSYVVIGAVGDDDNGNNSGSAYVFERDGVGTWQEVQKLAASDGAANDYFSNSASVAGSYALIGTYWDDDNGSDSGSAYLFERNGVGVWQEVQKLMASDGSASDNFGMSVSISGSYAVVGATGDDDNGNLSGSVYFFERDGTGTWQELQKLIASDGAADDYFGGSISISASYALIGAANDNDSGNYGGSAYVFER